MATDLRELTKEQKVALAKLRILRARRDLGEFGSLVFGYPAMAHHKRWIEALSDERIRYLMIMAPPSSGKTVWIGNIYPCWKGATDPAKHYCYLSFAQNVAESRASPTRLKIEEKRGEFRAVFPEIRPDSRRTWGKEEWSLVGADPADPDSTFTVASVTRGALGKHFHEIIVDDPHDPEEAVSKVGRERAWWFIQNVVLKRLLPGGRIIVDGFRWAEDDVPGRLMELFGWHLDSECNQKCFGGSAPEFHVVLTVAEPEEGVSYWPEFWPMEILEAEKKHEVAWNAQYLQRPRPAEGVIFRWFDKRYEQPPVFQQIVVGFDVAVTDKERSDWNAWSGWGIKDSRAYFLDAGRIKTQGGDAERHIGMFAEKLKRQFGKQVVIVHAKKVSIDKIVGQFLRRRNLPVVEVPMGDLLTTANLVAPYMEGGQVLWPEIMPDWFLEEMKTYDFGRHDDGVASAMAALAYVFLRARAPRVRRPIFLWDRDVA